MLAVAALVAVLASGCGKTREADLENGKRLYTGQLADGQKKPTENYQPCGAATRSPAPTPRAPPAPAWTRRSRRPGPTA